MLQNTNVSTVSNSNSYHEWFITNSFSDIKVVSENIASSSVKKLHLKYGTGKLTLLHEA